MAAASWWRPLRRASCGERVASRGPAQPPSVPVLLLPSASHALQSFSVSSFDGARRALRRCSGRPHDGERQGRALRRFGPGAGAEAAARRGARGAPCDDAHPGGAHTARVCVCIGVARGAACVSTRAITGPLHTLRAGVDCVAFFLVGRRCSWASTSSRTRWALRSARRAATF